MNYKKSYMTLQLHGTHFKLEKKIHNVERIFWEYDKEDKEWFSTNIHHRCDNLIKIFSNSVSRMKKEK